MLGYAKPSPNLQIYKSQLNEQGITIIIVTQEPDIAA
jgi:hypothetical protein